MSAEKLSESFPGRNFYRGSGVNWTRFLPWLILTFAVAAALAEGMYQLFHIGHYYVFIVPILAALAVAGMITLAVIQGQCRNRWIAGAAGFGAGVVLYLGSYYLGMVHLFAQFGQPGLAPLDRLPSYIRLRMETDVTRDAYRSGDEEKQPRSADATLNWLRFGIEFLVVLGLTTAAGLKRSRKAYCTQCGRWMERELTQFDPAQSTELLEALRIGSARSLAALCAKSPYTTVPNATLAVESCPSLKDGRSRDCPVYVSLKIVSAAAQGAVLDAFEQTKGKVLLRAMQLNPDEIAALGTRLKVFETVAGRAAVAALKPEEPAVAASESKPGAFAEIQPVAADYAGKVLTRRAAWVGLAIGVAALLLIFAGLGLAAWGGSLAFPDRKSPQPVSPQTKALGIAMLSVGLLCFGGTAIFFLLDPSFFANRHLRKRARFEFSRRPGCLVDPNDPDALFVEIAPKLNWGKMRLENADDVGFLRLDPRRREVLFEGDKQRFRLPADTITHCAVETHVEAQGSAAATKVFYVVLQARHPTEFWEAPIRERTGSGLLRSGRRKKSAYKLCESIQQMRGVGEAKSVGSA